MKFISVKRQSGVLSKFECEGYTDFKFKLKNYLSERKTAQPKSLDETMLIHFCNAHQKNY